MRKEGFARAMGDEGRGVEMVMGVDEGSSRTRRREVATRRKLD